MRLIDADALREAMYHEAFETDSDMQKWDGGCWIRYKMFENAIENAPTIEAKPIIYAHDISQFQKGHVEFKCSLCGVEIGVVEGGPLDGGYFKYCPLCGAKLEGTEE